MSLCLDVREELKAYADGELTTEERGSVRGHLDACPECRRELAVIERLATELRALDQAVPRPELRTRILDALPDAPGEPERGQKPPWWQIKWPVMALGTAAAAALILAFMLNRPPEAPRLEGPADSDEVRKLASKSPRDQIALGTGGNAGEGALERRQAAGDRLASPHVAAKTAAPEPATPDVKFGKAALPGLSVSRPLAAPQESKASSTLSQPQGKLNENLGSFQLPSHASKAPAGPSGPTPLSVESSPAGSSVRKEQNAPAISAKPGMSGQEPAKTGTIVSELNKKDNTQALRAPNAEEPAHYLKWQDQKSEAQEVYVVEVEQLEKGTAQVVNAAREEGGVVSPISNEGVQGSAFFTTILPKDRIEPLKAKLNKLGLNLRAEIQDQYRAGRVLSNGQGIANGVVGDEKNVNLGAGSAGGLGGSGFGGFKGGGRGGGGGNLGQQQMDGLARDKSAAKQAPESRYALKRANPKGQVQDASAPQTNAKNKSENQLLSNQREAGVRKFRENEQDYGRSFDNRARYFGYYGPQQMTKLIIQLRETGKPAAGKK